MAFTMVAITGQWNDPDTLQPVSNGILSFHLDKPQQDGVGHILSPATYKYELDQGKPPATLQLAANDDPGTLPIGNYYHMRVSLPNGFSYSMPIVIPHNAPADPVTGVPTFDVSKATPLVPEPPMFPGATLGDLPDYALDATLFGTLGADEHVNLATLTAAMTAAPSVGGAIAPPPGEWLISDTLVVPDRCGLWTPGAPATIDSAANIGEIPIRCWLAPGPSFPAGNPLIRWGKHCFCAGLGMDVSSLAAWVWEFTNDDFWAWCCSVFGGTTASNHLAKGGVDGATVDRVSLQTISFNNIANLVTNSGSIVAGGNDWRGHDIRKKGGTATLGSGGQQWEGHFTGGTPNLNIAAGGDFDGTVDSTKDATGPLIQDDRSGANAIAFTFAPTSKLFQNSAGTQVDCIRRGGANPSPLHLSSGIRIDAAAGAGFLSLINYVVAPGTSDYVGDLQAAFNAFSAGATPTLYKGGFPANMGTIYYRGSAYPALRGEAQLGVDTALPAGVVTNLFSTPTLQPGTYDIYAVATISITTTGGSVDLLLSGTGAMTGLRGGSGHLTAGSANQVVIFCTVVVTAAGVLTASAYIGAAVVGATARVLPNSGSGSALPASYMSWRRRAA